MAVHTVYVNDHVTRKNMFIISFNFFLEIHAKVFETSSKTGENVGRF
jgi:hypothetical protein